MRAAARALNLIAAEVASPAQQPRSTSAGPLQQLQPRGGVASTGTSMALLALVLLFLGHAAAATDPFSELTPLLVSIAQQLPPAADADPHQGQRRDDDSAALPALPWAAANVTVFVAAGKDVKPFPPAQPCHMPHNRNAPINLSLVGPFPRGLCCTGEQLLANYNDSDALNMSVRFDGTVLSAYLGLDCTSREITIRNGTKNVTVSSFVGNLSKCISGAVEKGSMEVGLSLVPVAASATRADHSPPKCPVLPPPAAPTPPAPPPPPAPPAPPGPAPPAPPQPAHRQPAVPEHQEG
eukprot:COSAG06_NODE_11108_length_1566_cov_1.137696_2_plen_294_part_01